MAALDDWVTQVETALGTGSVTDAKALLDLVRDVAHGVDRPAGPLTAYLVGVAVGRGMPLSDAIDAASAEVTRAAAGPQSLG
jgi:hypothetical protein